MHKRIGIASLALTLVIALVLPVTGCGEGELVLSPEMEQFIEDEVAGLKGEQGEQGVAGVQGLQGEPGEAGQKGDKGDTGATGIAGPTGEAGPTGLQGEQGEQGPAGGDGGTGAQGVQGIPGSTVASTFSVSLAVKNPGDASAMLFTSPVETGTHSIRLQTTSAAGTGDEGRIVITPLSPMTLAELTSMSWSEYLTAGYPPHIDIFLDTDGDGIADESLCVEYAYNATSHYLTEAPMPYGALTDAWYLTFGDDGNGPVAVDDTCYAWLNSGAPGPYTPTQTFGDAGHYGETLANWKAGQTVPATTIDGDALITRIEIEVDNWVVQPTAFVDNIFINGVLVWQ